MYKVLAFAVCCAVIVSCLAKPQDKEKKYTTKYDNIDLEEILNNERLLKNYYNCLMDESPCTPDGGELKKLLPDALENDCKSCSKKQREGAEIMIKHLIENKKDMWENLEKKYDSNKVYRKKYAKEAEQRGIKGITAE